MVPALCPLGLLCCPSLLHLSLVLARSVARTVKMLFGIPPAAPPDAFPPYFLAPEQHCRQPWQPRSASTSGPGSNMVSQAAPGTVHVHQQGGCSISIARKWTIHVPVLVDQESNVIDIAGLSFLPSDFLFSAPGHPQQSTETL